MAKRPTISLLPRNWGDEFAGVADCIGSKYVRWYADQDKKELLNVVAPMVTWVVATLKDHGAAINDFCQRAAVARSGPFELDYQDLVRTVRLSDTSYPMCVGQYFAGSYARPSAHKTACDIAKELADAVERAQEGSVLSEPNQLPILTPQAIPKLKAALEWEAIKLGPSAKGQPGRPTYPPKVLEYVQKLRQDDPHITAKEMWGKCLTQFSKHDLPAGLDAFGKWLRNHKVKPRKNRT
jgi:hypothetical protein